MLTNLAQIKDGLKLKQNVEKLLASYEAAKVVTNIVKTPASGSTPAVNYNVEEVLESLKTQLEAITGTSSGSGTSLASLQTAIDTISNKEIEDIVRLELPIVGTKATLPTDLDTKVPSVDKSVRLPVFTQDNELCYTENGEQLTLSLVDGSLNGTPSQLDVAASAKKTDGSKVYKAMSDFTGKVFPVGTWKLKDLPTDALIDNQEVQAIAYTNAIDKLAVEISQNTDLINEVKNLIGTEAIAKQLEAYRKVADKIKLDDLDNDLKDVIKTAATPQVFDPSDLIAEDAKKFDKANIVTSTVDTSASGYAASDDKVLSEKAALAKINAVKADVEAHKETQVTDKIAVSSATAVTEFALTQTPTDTKVVLYINHLAYFEGDDFTVDRTAKKVTWTLTAANNGFDITNELTDAVYIKYGYKA